MHSDISLHSADGAKQHNCGRKHSRTPSSISECRINLTAQLAAGRHTEISLCTIFVQIVIEIVIKDSKNSLSDPKVELAKQLCFQLSLTSPKVGNPLIRVRSVVRVNPGPPAFACSAGYGSAGQPQAVVGRRRKPPARRRLSRRSFLAEVDTESAGFGSAGHLRSEGCCAEAYAEADLP
jgi:hypothetical protein